MVKQITDKEFDETIKSGKVLVDFYADWCGPCKMMSPVVDEIAKEFSDKLKVCKINVDEAPEWAAEYGVMSIPTLIFFQNGNVVDTLVGLTSRSELISKI